MKFSIPKLSLLYLFVIILLFLYSYTQVDLSLTLSRASIFQTIEKAFQYIGWFQRPLSTELYLGLLVLLFGFYGVFISKAKKGKIEISSLWKTIIIMTVILTFSYNAFSYDLFNYIFDAKIFTHYHLNPYMYKALDFPHDPMLSFMRWTHRTYPYGPLWLVLTIPLSFVGLNFFLPTFFLFKMLMSISYLASVYFIDKILQKTSPKNRIAGIVLFALNPLVMIEALVSAHIDIVMVAFSLSAVNDMIDKKYVRSLIMLIISIGIKYATASLLPLYLFVFYAKKKGINWKLFFTTTSLLMIVPVVLETIRSQYQPWYSIVFIPFLALTEVTSYTIIPLVVIALCSLLEYVPFLYTGNWDPPIPVVLNVITISAVVISLLGMSFVAIKNRMVKHH